MATLKIPYETAKETDVYLALNVPDRMMRFRFIPQEPDPISDLKTALRKAVEFPVSGPKFSELLGPGCKITFIVENQFRPAPARELLSPLIEAVRKAGGIPSIIIGNAALPPLTPAEMEIKLGKALLESDVPVLFNEPNRSELYRYLGTTRAGTPLLVHSAVAEADRVVTISTTQSTVWGYGGSGMIIPAVAGNETIEINHLMSLAPDCIPGNNACLMELDKYEALEMAGVDLAINVIVSTQNKVLFMNAGSPVESHRQAVQFYNQIYRFTVPDLERQTIDMAIAGSTPFTDDLFFHTGWAVSNCDPIVRPGGIILLATRCTGYGGWPGFIRMEVLKNYLPPTEENKVRAIKDFYRDIVNGKKSFAWYRIYEVLTRKKLWLVTDKVNLPACREAGLTAFESMEEAFRQAVKQCGDATRIAFIPYGRSTIIAPEPKGSALLL